MANPSKQLDASKNPRTRCSNCQTVFEVPQELLTSSDTRVRCGECLSIFDALSELHSAEDKLHASVAHVTEATIQSDSLDVTYSDFDLFSDEADLPEIAYFDQTRDTPDFDFDAVEMGNDETFNDTLFVHDVTIDADATTLRGKPSYHQEDVGSEFGEMAYVDDEQPNEPVIFNYKEAEEPSPSAKPVWVDPAPLSIRFPRPKSSIVSEITRAPGARKPEPLKPDPPKPQPRKSEPVYIDLVDSQELADDGFPANDFPTDDFVGDEYANAAGFPEEAEPVGKGQAGDAFSGGSLFGRNAPEDILLDADGEDKRLFDKDSKGGLLGRKKSTARPKRVKSKGRNPWIFRGAMAGLFVVLVSSLLLFRSKPSLYNSPTMRPILEAGCTVLQCTVPARIDIPSLKMVKRNVFSHPNTPKALVINVSFRNDADFAQQLPLLHMVLSNRVGRVVARQDFSPPTYFPNWYEGAVIKAGQQLDVTLEVIDPGRDAQSFEFYFRQYKK